MAAARQKEMKVSITVVARITGTRAPVGCPVSALLVFRSSDIWFNRCQAIAHSTSEAGIILAFHDISVTQAALDMERVVEALDRLEPIEQFVGIVSQVESDEPRVGRGFAVKNQVPSIAG